MSVAQSSDTNPLLQYMERSEAKDKTFSNIDQCFSFSGVIKTNVASDEVSNERMTRAKAIIERAKSRTKKQ